MLARAGPIAIDLNGIWIWARAIAVELIWTRILAGIAAVYLNRIGT
jgi:hypothetical protein